jgi:outer membrane protein insertion porin family
MGQRQWIRAIARLIVLVVFLAALLPSPLTLAQGTAVFSRVDVAGNQRIEADTIRVFAGIEAGQPVSPEQLNLAVRRLFETGLFEDVTVMPEAGRLLITVVENPTINQIAFEGNDSLDDEELLEAIELRPRLAYSVAAAEADAQRIIDAYRAQGRYAASVTPVIIRQPDNRVDLVFEIFEGRVTSVQSISFTGNQVFSDRRLRRVIQTNQSNWLSFILGNVTYDADRLELDRELLRQFYLERGFLDFRVLSATSELTRERGGFFLAFTLYEGPRFNYGEVSVSSAIPGLNAADFEPLLAQVATRGVYNQRQVDRVVERMVYQAGQAGYAFVEIRPQLTRNEAARTVDINFQLVEGERVFVERIDISGNTRTLDRVIRRQFRLVEGDAFNAREVREAEDRINGLGYFQTATVSVREGSTPGRALVLVEVEEQPTGSLTLGGAYSTTEGFTAQIGLTERNFLGRGQTVSATISASTQFGNFEFGFFEPALFDRDLLAGFNIYYRERDFEEQSFQTSNVGFEPRLGFPLSENGRLTLRYRLSRDDIYNVLADTSQIIIREQGAKITSALAFTYAYDRRNSVVDPTAGFILQLNQEFAGLGGDVTHSKTQATARAYTSFFEEDLVLSAEVEGGYLTSQDGTRITDRFTAGGDSFRGFARNGIGPRDFCGGGGDQVICLPDQQPFEVDDALGGNYYSVLRLDASFPLGLPDEYGIYGGVFADVGSLWGLDDTAGSMGEVDDDFHIRSSVGVSLFVDTRFAPLRFNYAIPLEREDYDVVERFRFSLQTRF